MPLFRLEVLQLILHKVIPCLLLSKLKSYSFFSPLSLPHGYLKFFEEHSQNFFLTIPT